MQLFWDDFRHLAKSGFPLPALPDEVVPSGRLVPCALFDTLSPRMPGERIGDANVLGVDTTFDLSGHGTLLAAYILRSSFSASVVPVPVLDVDARGSASQLARGLSAAFSFEPKVFCLGLCTQNSRDVDLLAPLFCQASDRGILSVSAHPDGVALAIPASLPSVIGCTAVAELGGVHATVSVVGRRIFVRTPVLKRGKVWFAPSSIATAVAAGILCDLRTHYGALTQSQALSAITEHRGWWNRGVEDA